MNDKKSITVEIPILDNVDQMKVVETFTEEQLWYVCAIAKAFDKLQSNWNSLREWLKATLTNEEFCYLAENAKDRCRYDVFNEVLDKINELEGRIKNENNRFIK